MFSRAHYVAILKESRVKGRISGLGANINARLVSLHVACTNRSTETASFILEDGKFLFPFLSLSLSLSLLFNNISFLRDNFFSPEGRMETARCARAAILISGT